MLSTFLISYYLEVEGSYPVHKTSGSEKSLAQVQFNIPCRLKFEIWMSSLITIIIACLLLLLLLLINKKQASRFFSSFDKIDRIRCGRVFLFSTLFKSCAQNSAMASATCRSASASPLNSSNKKMELKVCMFLKCNLLWIFKKWWHSMLPVDCICKILL